MSQFFGKNKIKEMQEYKESIGGSGSFLNSKEITDKGIKIRIIPWMFGNEPEEIIPYFEGWEAYADEKGKFQQRPRRFKLGEEIPEGINWKMDSYKGGPQRPSIPKASIGFVCYRYDKKTIAVGAFSQVALVNAFMAMKDEEIENNQLYCENLFEVDIILSKTESAANKIEYKVTFAPKSMPTLPQDAMILLNEFHFSWEMFMQGKECFEEETGNTWADVQAGYSKEGDPKSAQNQPKTAPANTNISSGDLDELKNWKTVKRANGTLLGNMSLPDLQTLKVEIETKIPDEQKRFKNGMYRYVSYAVDHFESSKDMADEDIQF